MQAQQRWTTAWNRVPLGEGRRIRLLIEGPETAWFDAFAKYRAHGYEVAVCTGPGPDGGCCTLLTDGRCGLADDADVVISAVDVAAPSGRHLVDLLARRYPQRPLIFQTPHPTDLPVGVPGLGNTTPYDCAERRVMAIRALTAHAQPARATEHPKHAH